MRPSIYRFKLISSLILLTVIVSSCLDNDDFPKAPSANQSPQDLWKLEHLGYLRDGGVGKDGIPAIDFPAFIGKEEVSYLNEDDLVIVTKIGGTVKAYPHAILDWHEIINDVAQGQEYAIIYCPLTGTGVTWNRFINGKSTTFGVSGFLYNSNIIPFDRTTGSNWSQMLGKSVQGPLSDSIPQVFHSIEMTWQSCKEYFPEVQVVSQNTGYNRSYGQYPYISVSGDYRIAQYLIFSVSNQDFRKENKERVFGLIHDNTAKIYDFQPFESGTNVLNDQVGEEPVVVIGNKEKNYITAFRAIGKSGSELIFSSCDCFPAAMSDQLGNEYDILGEVIEGPDLGYRLPAVNGYIGYWFSWAAFYPDLELYE